MIGNNRGPISRTDDEPKTRLAAPRVTLPRRWVARGFGVESVEDRDRCGNQRDHIEAGLKLQIQVRVGKRRRRVIHANAGFKTATPDGLPLVAEPEKIAKSL